MSNIGEPPKGEGENVYPAPRWSCVKMATFNKWPESGWKWPGNVLPGHLLALDPGKSCSHFTFVGRQRMSFQKGGKCGSLDVTKSEKQKTLSEWLWDPSCRSDTRFLYEGVPRLTFQEHPSAWPSTCSWRRTSKARGRDIPATSGRSPIINPPPQSAV